VCDDGNDDDNDDCLSTCVAASCGDGFVWAGNEDCDDANDVDNDGCDAGCTSSTGIRKVVTGGYHTCALSWSGEVKCWGYNNAGQLGQGNTTDVLSPLDVGSIDLGVDLVVDLAAGYSHNCVMYEDQTMRCWGSNNFGQLGLGHINYIGDSELPVTAPKVTLGGDPVKFDLGGRMTCALLSDGAVRCWGLASEGLGYGNTNNIGDNENPSVAGDINVGADAVDITVGNGHVCVIDDQSEIRCWGWNNFGQLGYGNLNSIGDNEVPAQIGIVQHGNGTPVQIEAGGQHTCVRYDDDTLRCWGINGRGELGYGNTTIIGDNELPNTVGTVSAGGPVHSVMCKADETCVVLDDGDVRCWGSGADGQLGSGNVNHIGDNELPSSVAVVQVGAPVLAFAESGTSHVCVLTTDNGIRCWGSNFYGGLGYGNLTDIGDNEVPAFVGDVPY
jgi:cysteine-rich repeat protein